MATREIRGAIATSAWWDWSRFSWRCLAHPTL